MKSNRGFTLIEILVVIVVIALLVSITALNTDGDPRADALKLNAQKIKYYLEEATDEAILNNQSIAVYFTKFSASPYSWQKKPENNNQNGSSQPEKEESWQWTDYQSRKIQPIEFHNDSEIKLFINEAESPLSFQKKGIETVKPQLIIQASGIQPIIRLDLSLNDYDKSISLSGNGAGRFKLGAINDSL